MEKRNDAHDAQCGQEELRLNPGFVADFNRFTWFWRNLGSSDRIWNWTELIWNWQGEARLINIRDWEMSHLWQRALVGNGFGKFEERTQQFVKSTSAVFDARNFETVTVWVTGTSARECGLYTFVESSVLVYCLVEEIKRPKRQTDLILIT